ncbi:chemotaxis protein CheX [Sulfuricurvum sp.]|uniref:chemotaxis protein CheX n=1 Tax=Sulfuricurvum sp. TaxID=2025608 RepID=UPI00260D9D52|nr:chemotaxis protein CheX [Sulfuricurvum sp.]MDD2780682.1 chemotaxis protein CheX [Sulfuricurvum sp.]
MLAIIVHAAENFCQHQLRLPFERIESSPKKRTLLAYIDVEEKNALLHRVYIGCDEALMQRISEIFLGEDESDEQTLIDMLLETTNMIVGSAKVLAEESYETTISIMTPFFVSDDTSKGELQEVQHLSIDNCEMMIALKRL